MKMTGTKGFILYLEPAKDSALMKHLHDYYKTSMEKFARNEAHQYPPHSSITGFFYVKDTNFEEAKHSLIHIIEDSLKQAGLEGGVVYLKSIEKGMSSKPLRLKNSSSNLIADLKEAESKSKSDSNFPVVRISIDSPYCTTMASIFSKLVLRELDIQVRPKKVDHVSLAYYHHFSAPEILSSVKRPLKKVASNASLNGLKTSMPYADSTFDLNEKCDEDFYLEPHFELAKQILKSENFDDEYVKTVWDVVLYEIEESFVLEVPHDMRELCRWNNICTTKLQKQL